jgi:hypothetical protein
VGYYRDKVVGVLCAFAPLHGGGNTNLATSGERLVGSVLYFLDGTSIGFFYQKIQNVKVSLRDLRQYRNKSLNTMKIL